MVERCEGKTELAPVVGLSYVQMLHQPVSNSESLKAQLL